MEAHSTWLSKKRGGKKPLCVQATGSSGSQDRSSGSQDRSREQDRLRLSTLSSSAFRAGSIFKNLTTKPEPALLALK